MSNQYKGKVLITTMINEMWSDIYFIPSKSEFKIFLVTSYPYNNLDKNNRSITSAQQRKDKNKLQQNVLLTSISPANIIKIVLDPDAKTISIDVKLSIANVLGYYILKFNELSTLDYKVLVSQLLFDNKNIYFDYRTKEQNDKNELNLSQQQINMSLSLST
jgi:hypothetical protein